MGRLTLPAGVVMPNDDHQVKKWRNILWREWRNCHNKSYAEQLFELVADTSIGWGTRFTLISLDAVIGIVLGLLIGFVGTTEWAILRQLILAGAIVGAVRGGLASYRLNWRDWLARLSFSLPTTAPHSRLLIVGILQLIPTVIFGPFLWCLVIGLFWGMVAPVSTSNTYRCSPTSPNVFF